jgi:hypothetical protein
MVNSTMALSYISDSYLDAFAYLLKGQRAICEVFRQKISLRLGLRDLLSPLLNSSLTLFRSYSGFLSSKRIEHIFRQLKMALS